MITAKYKSWDAIVMKRYVEPVAFPGSSDPLSVDPLTERYDLVAVNTPDAVTLANHLPLRRISKGCRIIPAEVGDPCKITFNGDDYFAFMLTEAVPFKEACQ